MGSNIKHGQIIGLSWFSMIGFDFFLHAGVLAPIYNQDSPFLLDPLSSFIYIPIGYLSFLLLTILLYWLQLRLEITTFEEGLKFGLITGALTWGSFTLGLFSISTAPISLLLGWFIGQTVEMAIGAAVIGVSIGKDSLGSETKKVGGFVLLCLILGIIIQNL